ncbi:MAG: RNA polymerase sigma factor [Cytophagales bacterium]|nr:RNA polymerase sigma factor [Cytophagales bacterium]
MKQATLIKEDSSRLMILRKSSELKKLLKKAQKGDQRSQFELYEQFYGYAMSVALRFCDSREVAKEVVHDGFIKAFAKLASVTGEDSFKPWLRRIIVNTAIDYHRKEMSRGVHMDIVEHDVVDVSEDSLSKLSAEDIFEAIKLLPPAYRMVFTLYAVEGFKHEEIAQKLNISVGTSKSNLSKARVKLQGILSQMETPKLMSNG